MDKKLLRNITDPNIQRHQTYDSIRMFRAINKSNEEKHLLILSASILTSQVLLHYQEELKRMGSKYYKHEIKKHSNILQKHLMDAEEKEFDRLFDSDSEVTHQITSNLIEGISFLAKNGFANMLFLIKCEMVFKENPKRIENFVDKLIKEYGMSTNSKK